MCKRIVQDERRAPLTASGAYEGDTVRLSQPASTHMTRGKHHCGGPWWLLWLIWPMILLVKAAAQSGPHIVAALAAGWGTVALPLQIVGALALIIVGVVLLLRQRDVTREEVWRQ